MSDEINRLAGEYRQWVQRVQDTHDAVRYTYGFRPVDAASIEAVADYVILEMLKRPSVFKYQGLPYSARIGALAGPFLNREKNETELADLASWDEIQHHLMACREVLQAVIVCAFVHGETDECISGAIGRTPEESAGLRSEALAYLANVPHGGGQGESSGIAG